MRWLFYRKLNTDRVLFWWFLPRLPIAPKQRVTAKYMCSTVIITYANSDDFDETAYSHQLIRILAISFGEDFIGSGPSLSTYELKAYFHMALFMLFF